MLVGLVLIRTEASSLDGLRLALQRSFGSTLHVEVERRVDLETLLVELLAELRVELLTDPFDEVGRGLAGDGFVRQLQRVRASATHVGLAYVAGVAHQAEHGVAALDGAFGETNRVVACWRLGERGERCCFGEVEIAHRLAEVALGCSLDAIGPVAEVYLIEVELEDF